LAHRGFEKPVFEGISGIYFFIFFWEGVARRKRVRREGGWVCPIFGIFLPWREIVILKEIRSLPVDDVVIEGSTLWARPGGEIGCSGMGWRRCENYTLQQGVLA
jgi:hypothetical protein